jgi:hypothetical protein
MPKIQFNSLTRPARKTETRTFTDPEQLDVSLTLTLQAPDAYEQLLINDKAEAFAKEFEVNYFPLASGGCVQVTEGVAKVLSGLEMMQVVESEEDRYTAHDLVGMLVNCPAMAEEVLVWAGTILPQGDTPGNPLGAGELSGSAPS